MKKGDIASAIRGILFLPKWHAQKWHKRDQNLWTFDAWSGIRYSDNPRALYEYVLAHEPSIRAVWITNSTDVYQRLKSEGKPVAMRYTKEGQQIQKDSGVFFCTHGRLNNASEGDLRYMNGIRYVNLWHGVPFKQVGDDERALIVKQTWWKKIKTRIRKCIVPWEFITGEMVCGSPFFKPFLQSAFGKYFNLINTPEPRLDKLVSPTPDSITTELNLQFENPLKILYMPTFRDTNFGKFNPFEMAGFNRERLEKMLKSQNMVLLYKGHFLDQQNGVTHIDERIRVVGDTDYDDLYTFIKDVDVLITDYSSIYFDFLCLRKPMILFPFDYSDYSAHSRKSYFDYNLMEAKRVYTWQEMEECLKKKTYYPPSEEEIQRFRPLPIGNCCEQLVDYLKQ